MSFDGQIQNYSQINLSAIKNTKLFQKFMQNKSGLILNQNSESLMSGGLPKKQLQTKTIQTKQGVQLNSKRWNFKNNFNNQESLLKVKQKQIIEIRPNNRNFPEESNYIKEGNARDSNEYKQNVDEFQKSNQIQYSYVESFNLQKKHQTKFDRNTEKQSNTTQNKTFPEKYQNQQQKSHQVTQTYQPKRKRNFNPYVQNARVRDAPILQPIKSTSIKQNPIHQDKTSIENSNQIYQDKTQINNYQINKNISPSYKLSPKHNKNDISTNIKILNSFTNASQALQLLQPSDTQYKKKYQMLQRKYQELRIEYKNQNKERRKQFNDWQHEIEVIKQKLFHVQSRQDSLLIQNQRFKEKYQNENLQKVKSQEENKDLGYKIKELQDQLQMKQIAIKQKNDEKHYWKTQAETIKQDFNSLKLALQKKLDQYNLLYGDYQLVKKQKDNKNYILQDLRHNINLLVEQNSAAKDELFGLITKLYQLEQENQILKNDLKRQHLDPSQMNYMRERVHSVQVQKQERVQKSLRQQRNSFVNELPRQNIRQSFNQMQKSANEKPNRKRGEFARQRGHVVRNQRPQKDEKPLMKQTPHNRSLIEEPDNQKSFKPIYGNNRGARIEEIMQQLQKIKDMKAMNGAIRRKKIDLQRQLQQLEGQ